MSEKLAIDGGTPVRTKPWPRMNPGEAVIGEEEKKEVLDVLDARSPFRFYGPDVQKKAEQLEKEFSEYVGVEHALGVTSGTAALRVAISAAGIGPGDEVIIPSVTFIATAGAVITGHARPIVADVGPDMGLDPEDVERKITSQTKAILPVPILGGAADMDPIMDIARTSGLIVIEDCAQSAGAEYKGRRIGSIGHINAFSLQFQNVITAGEGGIVTTNDDDLWERAIRAHDHGNSRWGHKGNDEKAFCAEVYRMSELAGAFALAQSRKLDSIIEAMRAQERKIRAVIEEMDGLTLRPLADPDGATGQTLGFMCETVELATKWRQALEAEGIAALLLYGGTLVSDHPQIATGRVCSKLGSPYDDVFYDTKIEYTKDMFPRSRELLNRMNWLWMSPTMTDEDTDDVITALRKVHRGLMG